jgi:hypothetical protein
MYLTFRQPYYQIKGQINGTASQKELLVMAARSLYMVTLLGLAAGGCIQAAERPDFSGNWQLDPSRSELHSPVPPGLIWQIGQTADSIHVIEHAGDKDLYEFKCFTDGKECKVKNGGHAAIASFYYNGPILVELETMGKNRGTVIKKTIHLSGDGSMLTINVMHVLPEGKEPEKLVMTKKPDGQLAASSAK